jgi:hypothetical protein
MQRHQAELVLQPVLPDRDDARYDTAVTAWTERLARGVAAGLISEDQARSAVGRLEVGRVA